MTKTKVFFLIASLAIALVASAADKTKKHDLTLFDTVKVGATELKAGEYKVSVQDNMATFFLNGQQVAQVPVKTEVAGAKFDTNAIVTDENHSIREIQLAGWTEKLILE